MLKTYRIIPFVFILFLFGFTFITVAPVFAWDPSMGMRHPDRPCMKNAREKGPRFGCGPDMRSPEQIASDPYDTKKPISTAQANFEARRKSCMDGMESDVGNRGALIRSMAANGWYKCLGVDRAHYTLHERLVKCQATGRPSCD